MASPYGRTTRAHDDGGLLTGGEHYYVVVFKLISAAEHGIVFVVSDQLTDFS